MSRSIRSWHLLAGLAVAAIMFHPAPAGAWPCRWRADVCGPPVSGGCGITFGVGRGVTSFCTIGRGWGPCGFGFTSYRTFLYSTPGFWCGWSYPCVVAPAWNWCAPYPPFPCGLPVTCYPWSYAPVYGPVGVYPYLGLRPFQAATGLQGGGLPALALRQPVRRAVDPIRVSNVESRRRAGKLVALGDRHLRAAVADRGRLQAALDAYRRAEVIAADQPDTILRQAIVLAALDRSADSAAAVQRAAGLDGRLADDAQQRDDIGHLPPDPVFGDRPLGARSPLEIRGAVLLAGIFPGGNDVADGPNWIADRWSRQVQADLQVAARR